MIELTIHAANTADLKRQLAELLGGAAPLEPSTTEPSSAGSGSSAKATKPTKPSPEKTKSSGEPEDTADIDKAEPETPPADDTGKTEPAVDYDAVKAATLALVKAKGRDAAVKVLTAHGAAAGATELKPEQYGDYLAAVQEAMA